MQTRNMPLTELEPERFTHSRVEENSLFILSCGLLVRRRHRKVENRTEQETKVEAFEIAPAVASRRIWTVVIPVQAVFVALS